MSCNMGCTPCMGIYCEKNKQPCARCGKLMVAGQMWNMKEGLMCWPCKKEVEYEHWKRG